ncbi:hypothetical protein WMY93_010156 [Mugilogobius chulae]|uniref:Uncharacterized protein n=1 Tax=Mugilogobius chulae TaxID=88201 RepID=A0AAW0PFI9_9GOBI
MLAAMGVIEETNDGVQWCEPTQPQENKSGDTPEALEAQSQPAVSLVQSPTEQVTAVDTQQQVSTEETTDVSCLNVIEDQSCKPPGMIENTKPDVTKGADGTPREQKCIVLEEETIQSETEQESVDENITAENTEPVEVTSSNESPAGRTQETLTIAAQDAPSQVDLGLLPPDVLPMLAAMGVIQESNDGIQWCEPTQPQENKTPSDVVVADVTQEYYPEALEAQSQPAISLVQSPTEQVTAVDTQQQVSTEETTDVSCLNLMEDQSCKPPGIIENTEPNVTQGANETANVEATHKEELAPQEPATYNQERMPEEEIVPESTLENIAHEEAPATQEQAPETFQEEEMDVPLEDYIYLDTSFDHNNIEDDPFYIEDNLPEDLSTLNIQELMDDILEPYSLQITAIQMNSVPIEALPKDDITPRIVELGSEDCGENCDTIQADVSQVDASLQLQQYQRFPWPRLQLTPNEVRPLPQITITPPEEEETTQWKQQ